MSNIDLAAPSPENVNRRILVTYLILAAVAYLAIIGYLGVQGKRIPLMVALGAPVLVCLLTQPKWALYAFAFSLMVKVDVITSLAISVTDVAALVLIGAATLDFFLNSTEPATLPRVSFNYLALLTALVIAGVFSYNPMLATRPIARVAVLFLTFLAMRRAAGKTNPLMLLKFFFWLVAAHASIAVIDFASHGGRIRSFGLVDDTLDDFTMLALPIGIVLFLWERRGAIRNLLGVLLVLGGLVATQSRAPLLFDVPAVILAVWWSRRRAIQGGQVYVKQRIRRLIVAVVALAAVVPLLKPGIFSTFGGRFEKLLTTTPGETFRLRLVIWSRALRVFSEHPIFGLGPGTFRYYSDIYPTAHLQLVGFYVRSLSAHNLTLHYLAETGLTGALALLALFASTLRYAWRSFKGTVQTQQQAVILSLLVTAMLLMYSTLFEAGWMWGETSYAAMFFVALVAGLPQRVGRQQENT